MQSSLPVTTFLGLQLTTILTGEFVARILDITRKAPLDGATRWSARRLANRLGVSHMIVARGGASMA
jgi:hypothetical protein